MTASLRTHRAAIGSCALNVVGMLMAVIAWWHLPNHELLLPLQLVSIAVSAALLALLRRPDRAPRAWCA